MRPRPCRYCQQLFQPSPYHPDQRVCGQSDCQRQRRRDYHRQKIDADPLYRQVCLESPRKWRQQHPGYWKEYRRTHPQAVERNRQRQRRRDQRRRLLNLANNNLALDLKRSAAEVWLLGPGATPLANNNLAHCQLLIFPVLDPPPTPPPASCQQHPSGLVPPSALPGVHADG
jgi:hypothetical protein